MIITRDTEPFYWLVMLKGQNIPQEFPETYHSKIKIFSQFPFEEAQQQSTPPYLFVYIQDATQWDETFNQSLLNWNRKTLIPIILLGPRNTHIQNRINIDHGIFYSFYTTDSIDDQHLMYSNLDKHLEQLLTADWRRFPRIPFNSKNNLDEASDFSYIPYINQIQKELFDLYIYKNETSKHISAIAHDFKNLVGGMAGVSHILSESEGLQDKDSDTLDLFAAMINAFDDLQNMVDQFLFWSRIHSGKQELYLENISIKKHLIYAQEKLAQQIHSKQITLDIQIDEQLTWQADAVLIQRVFTSLLSNALKFSHPKNTIKINAKEIVAQSTPDNPYLLISITDHGIGMKDKELKKLFNAESKFSKLGTHQEHGSGYGLLLCKTYIEKHQGEIWIESTHTEGTTVYFTLPKSIIQE